MERNELERELRLQGVPYDSWGRSGFGGKTLDDLLREIHEDGVRIYTDGHGRVIAKRIRAFVHAEYVNPNSDTTYKLEEQARVFRDGSFDARIFADPTCGTDEERPSLSETMRRGETAEEAALRGVRSELTLPAFPLGRIELLGYVIRNIRRSRTYPGIWSEETGWELRAKLRWRDCRKLYIERGVDGVVTLIGWRGGRIPPHVLRRNKHPWSPAR